MEVLAEPVAASEAETEVGRVARVVQTHGPLQLDRTRSEHFLNRLGQCLVPLDRRRGDGGFLNVPFRIFQVTSSVS